MRWARAAGPNDAPTSSRWAPAARSVTRAGRGTTAGNLLLFNGDEAGYAPQGANIATAPGWMVYGAFNMGVHIQDIYTNAAAQIRVRADASVRPLYIYTRGWIDTRGRMN